MQVDDVDANLKYLVLTLAIIMVAGVANNYMLTADDAVSFGYCDTELDCTGATVGSMCLGIEHRDTTCSDPNEAPAWQKAEIECGLAAQGLCSENTELSGLDWTDHENATWDGRQCTAWESEHEEFDLLTCENTFRDIRHWE